MNYWGWEAVNKSVASAASPDSVKLQAVIKSAASAASRKPKIVANPGERPEAVTRQALAADLIKP